MQNGKKGFYLIIAGKLAGLVVLIAAGLLARTDWQTAKYLFMASFVLDAPFAVLTLLTIPALIVLCWRVRRAMPHPKSIYRHRIRVQRCDDWETARDYVMLCVKVIRAHAGHSHRRTNEFEQVILTKPLDAVESFFTKRLEWRWCGIRWTNIPLLGLVFRYVRFQLFLAERHAHFWNELRRLVDDGPITAEVERMTMQLTREFDQLAYFSGTSSQRRVRRIMNSGLVVFLHRICTLAASPANEKSFAIEKRPPGLYEGPPADLKI